MEGARELANLLQRESLRIVLAESCTSGLVSAKLGSVPGISSWLCGSAVTYREATKISWLGVAAETLVEKTAESAETTLEMASSVLEKTPEADLAAAITGHLGPNTPAELDGVVFIAVVFRGEAGGARQAMRFRLEAEDRQTRMTEAAQLVLTETARRISNRA